MGLKGIYTHMYARISLERNIKKQKCRSPCRGSLGTRDYSSFSLFEPASPYLYITFKGGGELNLTNRLMRSILCASYLPEELIEKATPTGQEILERAFLISPQVILTSVECALRKPANKC